MPSVSPEAGRGTQSSGFAGVRGHGHLVGRGGGPRALVSPSVPQTLIPKRRETLALGPVYRAMCQTLRRLGGRQPLWGTGVMSLIPVISIPTVCIERIAVSRPEPGPLT